MPFKKNIVLFEEMTRHNLLKNFTIIHNKNTFLLD